MNVTEQLKAIKAGVNYPSSIVITETFKGKEMKTMFHLSSYFVGMYCAIYCNNKLANQTGDHDNKKFVTTLIRDIKKAIKRGASVEIGLVRPIKTSMN